MAELPPPWFTIGCMTHRERRETTAPFTLLMAVYGGNSLREVERSVQSSTIEQTLPPNQVVIVRDGPVQEPVQRYLDTLQSTMAVWFTAERPELEVPEVTIVPLDENRGLAHALNIGLQHCDFDVVARADCDDVSLPNRFATIIPQFTRRSAASHTTVKSKLPIDVMGSAIREFTDDERQPGQIRMLPAEGADLEKYARMQSPVHHPSVVFRKSAVLAAGGYPEDAGRFEDYLLWERMMLNHAQFLNMPEPLVLYRTNQEAYERRGGWGHVPRGAAFAVALPARRFHVTRTVPAQHVHSRRIPHDAHLPAQARLPFDCLAPQHRDFGRARAGRSAGQAARSSRPVRVIRDYSYHIHINLHNLGHFQCLSVSFYADAYGSITNTLRKKRQMEARRCPKLRRG